MIKLALDSTTGSPVIPEDLSKELTELTLKQCPLLSLLPAKQANGATHSFIKVSSLPYPNFVGEKAEGTSSSATFTRASVTTKIIKMIDGVTDYLIASAGSFINAYNLELELARKGFGYKLESYLLWGNATADPYQFDGFDAQITTNRIQHNAVVDLPLLTRQMLAKVRKNAPMDNLVFICDPEMADKISSLQTQIYKTMSTKEVEVDGGFIMETIKRIPIYESSYCMAGPANPATITATASSTSGQMTTGATYKYRLSAVTINGEQGASAEATVTLNNSKTSVDLTWTANSDAYLYKIYRTEANGGANTEKIVAVIPGYTYDANGDINGCKTSYNDGAPDTAIGSDVFLLEGESVIFLIDRDVANPVAINAGALQSISAGEKVTDLILFKKLASTNDAEKFMLFSYIALENRNELCHAIARKVKLA